VGDLSGALGFVRYQDRSNRYVVTRGELLDDLAILMGGREAERLLLKDVSIGAGGDLYRATSIARAMIEEFGFGDDAVGMAQIVDWSRGEPDRREGLAPSQLEAVDQAIRELLNEAKDRAATILKENRKVLELLRDELVARKVIDSKTLTSITQQ